MVISSIFIKVGLEIQEKVFSTRRVMYSIHKEYDSSRQQNLQLLDDPSVIYMESNVGIHKGPMKSLERSLLKFISKR